MIGNKDVKAEIGILLKHGSTSKKVEYFTQKRLIAALRRMQSPAAFAKDAAAKKEYGTYKKMDKMLAKDKGKHPEKDDQNPKLAADMKRIKSAAQKDAREIAQALYERGGYFLRCKSRADTKSRRIIIDLVQQRVANGNEFIPRADEDEAQKEERLGREYTWVFEGSQTKRTILMVLIIIGFLAMSCFPMWPNVMKVGVWYLSVTFLIFMFILVVIRTISFAVAWCVGYEFWILPNLFAEVGIMDSFRPSYRFHKSEATAWYYRVIAFIIFLAFGYWVYQQPTEFDEYISIQRQVRRRRRVRLRACAPALRGLLFSRHDTALRPPTHSPVVRALVRAHPPRRSVAQFIDDLYSGKMITDMAAGKGDLDEIKVPTFEEMQNLFTEDDDDSMESSILDALVDSVDIGDEDAADAAMDARADAEDAAAAAAAAVGDADASSGEAVTEASDAASGAAEEL